MIINEIVNELKNWRETQVCHVCHGTKQTKHNDRGDVWWQKCATCNGLGTVQVKLKLEFVIGE